MRRILSALVAITSISLALYPSAHGDSEEIFFQHESNLQGVEDDLSLEDQISKEVQNLPLSSRKSPFDLSSLVSPPSLPQTQTIGVLLFPAFHADRKYTKFMLAMPDSARPAAADPYAVVGAPDLSSVKLAAVTGKLSLYDTRGNFLDSGTELSFDAARTRFTLDKKRSRKFDRIYVTRGKDEKTTVSWKSERGQRKYDYPGGFLAVAETIPKGEKTVNIVNIVDLESVYVPTVLPVEMSPLSYSVPSLEAQATAIRTFAYDKIKLHRSLGYYFDVVGGAADQVYAFPKRKEQVAAEIAAKSEEVVKNTSGKVLVHNGHFIKAMYSAHNYGYKVSFQDWSGGRTNLVYLSAGPERSIKGVRALRGGIHHETFNTWDLATQLNQIGIPFNDTQVFAIRPGKPNSSHRPTTLDIVGPQSSITISGRQLSLFKTKLKRQASDGKWLKITFGDYIGEAQAQGNNISIPIYGSGHGVGMCQECTLLLSDYGDPNDPELYKKILSFYYPHTEIVDMNQSIDPVQDDSGL